MSVFNTLFLQSPFLLAPDANLLSTATLSKCKGMSINSPVGSILSRAIW